MTEEEQALRGQKARELLANPLLTEAFETIEKEVYDAWLSSPARDDEGREKLWLKVKLLHKLRGQLELIVETGRAAEASLVQKALEASREAGRKLLQR